MQFQNNEEVCPERIPEINRGTPLQSTTEQTGDGSKELDPEICLQPATTEVEDDNKHLKNVGYFVLFVLLSFLFNLPYSQCLP